MLNCFLDNNVRNTYFYVPNIKEIQGVIDKIKKYYQKHKNRYSIRHNV